MSSPLSRVCKGLRDRRGSASCSLALSINSRGFCKENQSQFSSSVSPYSPFSFSILLCSLFCTRLYYYNTLVIPCLHYYILYKISLQVGGRTVLFLCLQHYKKLCRSTEEEMKEEHRLVMKVTPPLSLSKKLPDFGN